MPHAHSHFQPIGELPSEHGLTIWGYATRRAPEALSAPGYFQAFQHHIKLGDLLLVRHTGERIGPDVAERPAPELALYGIDKDARGTIVLHRIWRFAWADARAAAAGTPAAGTPDAGAPPADGPPADGPEADAPEAHASAPAGAASAPAAAAGSAPAAGQRRSARTPAARA